MSCRTMKDRMLLRKIGRRGNGWDSQRSLLEAPIYAKVVEPYREDNEKESRGPERTQSIFRARCRWAESLT